MRFRAIAIGVISAFAATSFGAVRAAGAQSSGTLIRIPYRTYVGINPMGVPFDIGSVEVENAVAAGITAGGQGSITDLGDDRFFSVDLKVRYYPGEVVLRGFSLGLSAGSLRYSSLRSLDTGGRARESLTAPTIGILADYNWLLGTSRRFVVGTGLGAKRILASRSDRDRVGLDRAYATMRFVVGLAF